MPTDRPSDWPRDPQSVLEGIDLLTRAVHYTHSTLRPVSVDLLTRPTPCAGWDLQMLLMHMDDALLAFTDSAEIGYVDVHPAPGSGAADRAGELVGRLEARACGLLHAWRESRRGRGVVVGDRALTPELVAATGALEIAVHGWDVAQACGIKLPIPSTLAADLLELAPLLVENADRPLRFADPIDVPLGAGPAARLLGFLGRRESTATT